MTPTATLNYPNRLNLRGEHLFEKGVATPVDFALARELDGDPRFTVEGLNTREAFDHFAREARPTGELLLEAIREAADSLDVDDDASFDRNGKPDHRAISEVLGYPITVEERDRAISGHAGKLEAADQEQPAEERHASPKKSVVIKRAAKTEAAPEPAAEDGIEI